MTRLAGREAPESCGSVRRKDWRATPGEDDSYVYAIAL